MFKWVSKKNDSKTRALREFLEKKYKDAWFSSDENISKKQRKLAKIILQGAKRQERKLKRELKTLHKQIEKAKSQES